MINYSLNDFLLFSADVYWRLIHVYTQDFSIIAIAANVSMMLLLIGLNQSNTPRLIYLLLAPLWIWLGWRFYIIEYASINWSAHIFGMLCLIQAPLFIAIGVRMNTRQYEIDYAIIIAAIIYICLIRPVILWPLTQDWQPSELGLLPIPTILLSFALLLAVKIRFRWLMVLIPGTLMIVETVTLFLLATPAWQEVPRYGPHCLSCWQRQQNTGKETVSERLNRER